MPAVICRRTYSEPEAQSSRHLRQACSANSIFLRGPKLFDVDISVIKSIGIWERVKFNIYAEFLNAFNHPNFNFIDGYSFGTNNPAQYLPVNSGPYAREP